MIIEQIVETQCPCGGTLIEGRNVYRCSDCGRKFCIDCGCEVFAQAGCDFCPICAVSTCGV